MPKYQFVEHEYTKSIIIFEADSLEHAKELLNETLDWADLPESEKFWKSGETDWETPEEVDDEDEYKGSNRVGEMYGDND
jgi:hypothetical protein